MNGIKEEFRWEINKYLETKGNGATSKPVGYCKNCSKNSIAINAYIKKK